MLTELVALVVIVVIVLTPIVVLIARLRGGEPTTGGSSFGRQYFGRNKDDWGPKSST